jgi:CENP-B N-terminal DNA-binding domain
MRKLTNLDHTTIIAASVSGESPTQIARRFKVSRQTVSTIVNNFRRQQTGIADLDGMTYKARIKRKAITALESGLDAHTEDPLRAGVLGLGALKEMNALADEGGGSFADWVASIPEECRELYDQPLPEPRMLSPEQHEAWALELFKTHSSFFPTGSDFVREREDARAGRRRLVSNAPELEEFFQAEQARAKLGSQKRASREFYVTPEPEKASS